MGTNFNPIIKLIVLFLIRVRLANFLAPVASEANMGGPLGWISGLGIDGLVDVIEKFNNTFNDS